MAVVTLYNEELKQCRELHLFKTSLPLSSSYYRLTESCSKTEDKTSAGCFVLTENLSKNLKEASLMKTVN